MTLISDQQLRQFREQGYFVTDPMFSQRQLDDLSGEFDRVHQEFVQATEKKRCRRQDR